MSAVAGGGIGGAVGVVAGLDPAGVAVLAGACGGVLDVAIEAGLYLADETDRAVVEALPLG